jgi:hypothetical protein
MFRGGPNPADIDRVRAISKWSRVRCVGKIRSVRERRVSKRLLSEGVMSVSRRISTAAYKLKMFDDACVRYLAGCRLAQEFLTTYV